MEDFRIGKWLVFSTRGVIASKNEKVHLEPRVMDLLVYLAEHSDEVLSKERLIHAVWPDTFVLDYVLTSAVWKLRQALGEDSENPIYIQTVPRRGYALLAKVVFPGKAGADPSSVLSREVLPYPGLSPFTANQAEYFFGRALEVEVMWEKLHRFRLLGVIGPSGSGKSSFLQAGLAPQLPAGWAMITAKPRSRPFLGLAEALSGEISQDPSAVKQLLRFEEPDILVSLVSKWRSLYQEVLIGIDQFEELFTLNPTDTQERFIEFLGRLVRESGVHLLLLMRDDFLFHCHGHKSLEPIFDSAITPIGAPSTPNLERALRLPAEKCGFRFEDDQLVQEMLESVAEERGALPLLAFAASQLWDRRDKGQKLLTRSAYQEIGGVEGALARHAEATLERIGSERTPTVRELFRNLITSRGTRSVKSHDELLSVFEVEQLSQASEVLEILIDSRLLVIYRHPSLQQQEEYEHRIAVVHESLLTHWPRLVRWQAQDTDSARLREELHQASQIWDRHNRSEDLLWTGSAYSEYKLWRERYSGGLTDLERIFGKAMTEQAQLQSRRKRLAITTVLVFAFVAIFVTATMWRRAVTETHRAEAAHLFSIAQQYSESDPTAAIAYATKSLEAFDTDAARLFVTGILSQGPIAFTRETESDCIKLEFSPDGNSLIAGGHGGLHEIWYSDGTPPLRLTAHGDKGIPGSDFSHDGHFMISQNLSGAEKEIIVWEFPELNKVKMFNLDSGVNLHPRGLITLTKVEENPQKLVRLIPFEGNSVETLGHWPDSGDGWNRFHFGSKTVQNVIISDHEHHSDFYLVSGRPGQVSKPRRLAETRGRWLAASFLPDGNRFATYDESREINIWSLNPEESSALATFEGPEESHDNWSFDRSGSWLASANGAGGKTASIWDLTGPVSGGPQILRHGNRVTTKAAVHPEGTWVAVADTTTLSYWPLRRKYPSILFQGDVVASLAFDLKNTFLAGSSVDGSILLWSLESTGNGRPKVLYEQAGIVTAMAVSPDDQYIAAGREDGTIVIIPVSGDPVRELTGLPPEPEAITFDQTGHRLAAASSEAYDQGAVICIWDLTSKAVQVLHLEDPDVKWLRFEGQNRLYSSGWKGLRSWNLEESTSELLIPDVVGKLSPNGRFFLAMKRMDSFMARGRDLTIRDLVLGNTWSLPSHGNRIIQMAWHPSGKAVATSNQDGILRVSTLRGERTHLFYGHVGGFGVEMDPGGKWIASAGMDGKTRLWPMPDLSKSPFHTLPHSQLMSELKSMTNYRVVEDEGASTGYKIYFDTLPGWDRIPEW